MDQRGKRSKKTRHPRFGDAAVADDGFDTRMLDELISVSESTEKRLIDEMGGVEEFSAMSAFKRSQARKQEKIVTEKLLSRVEKRSQTLADSPPISAQLKRDSVGGKRLPSSSATMGVRRQVAVDSREKARANMLSYMKALTVEDVKIQAQKEQETTIRKYESTIDTMRMERDEAIFQFEEAEGRMKHMEDEIQSLKYTIQLQEKKIQKMGEREMENQQNLMVYQHMAPVLHRLKEEYQFATPQEIIDRLEMQKTSHLELLRQYQEVLEAKTELEKTTERIRGELHREYQTQVNEAKVSKVRADERAKEADLRVEEMHTRLHRVERVRDQYLVLEAAVRDLWHKWSHNLEELQGSDIPDPDMSKPIAIVSALHNLFIEFCPSRAGEHYRQLSGMANRFWVKFFQDEMEIKSKPAQIFEKLGKIVEDSQKKIEKLKKQLEASKKETHGAQEECRKLELALKQEKAEVGRLHNVRGIPRKKKVRVMIDDDDGLSGSESKEDADPSTKEKSDEKSSRHGPRPSDLEILAQMESFFLTQKQASATGYDDKEDDD